MACTEKFYVGSRSVDLNPSQMSRLLEASTPRDAYKSGEGLWSKICDFFCIGNDRQVIKKLFMEINKASDDVLPSQQISRFKELSRHANASSVGTFLIDVKSDCNFREYNDVWSYELTVGGVSIYESPKYNGRELIKKDLCLEEMIWNNAQAVDRINCDGGLLEQYVELVDDDVYELKSSLHDDCDELKIIGGFFLEEIKDDTFYSAKNFQKIRFINKDEGEFLIYFSDSNGRNETIFLNSRISGSMEHRSLLALVVLKNQRWNSLDELLFRDYGTCKDMLLQLTINHFMDILGNKTSKEFIDEPVVTMRLCEEKIARNGCAPVCLISLLNESIHLNERDFSSEIMMLRS